MQDPAAWHCGPFARKTGQACRASPSASAYRPIGSLSYRRPHRVTHGRRERIPCCGADTERTPICFCVHCSFSLLEHCRIVVSRQRDSHRQLQIAMMGSPSLSSGLMASFSCPLSFLEVYCQFFSQCRLSFILIWYTLKTVPDLYSTHTLVTAPLLSCLYSLKRYIASPLQIALGAHPLHRPHFTRFLHFIEIYI